MIQQTNVHLFIHMKFLEYINIMWLKLWGVETTRADSAYYHFKLCISFLVIIQFCALGLYFLLLFRIYSFCSLKHEYQITPCSKLKWHKILFPLFMHTHTIYIYYTHSFGPKQNWFKWPKHLKWENIMDTIVITLNIW